jgi:CysZ protein
MIGEFFRGLRAPFRALGLLASAPRLRKLAMLPLVVNMALFAVGVPLVVWLGVHLIGTWLPANGAIESVLRVLLEIVIAAAVIVGSLFLFVVVGNVIAAPFNSALSEAIEEHLTGRASPDTAGVFAGAMRGVITALGRLALFVFLYPPILVTQFIPVVGIVLQPVLATLYGAFVLSLDFSDPTFERHLPRFRDRVGHIGRHKARYLGFGLTAVVMAIIPLVNFLLLPVGVAGAALLYLEEKGG